MELNSLGKRLWFQEKDFILLIFQDGELVANFDAHRFVLQAQCKLFDENLYGSNYFKYCLNIPCGNKYLKCLEHLLKFMYTCDFNDLIDSNETLELCVLLEMQKVYNLLQLRQKQKKKKKSKPKKKLCLRSRTIVI